MIIQYDNQFNQNEWFIIVLLIVTYAIAFLLPKRFPVLISTVFILYAIAIGHFIDHTISVSPFDFYDVNDKSHYEYFDFLSYVMYGPFGYLIAYIFDRYNLDKRHIIIYILLWSLVAVGFEFMGIKFGVYHYDKGWKIQYSFPAYLVINSILMILYYKLCRRKDKKI